MILSLFDAWHRLLDDLGFFELLDAVERDAANIARSFLP